MWYTLGHSFGARHEHYWHSNICLSCIHLFAVIAFPQHLCMQARPGRCCVRLRVIFSQDQNVYGTCTGPPRKLYIYMHHTTTPGWLFGTNGKYYWQHRPRVTIIFTITRATRNVYLVPLSLSLPCPRGHISTTMYNNNNNTIYEIHRTNEDEIGVFAAISPKAKTPHTSTPHNINIKKKSHLIFHRPQKIVWHGSSTLGERAMDTYCDAWHSASSDKMGLASSLLGNKLLDQERYSCDNRFVVLCIEVLSHQESRRKRDLGR